MVRLIVAFDEGHGADDISFNSKNGSIDRLKTAMAALGGPMFQFQKWFDW